MMKTKTYPHMTFGERHGMDIEEIERVFGTHPKAFTDLDEEQQREALAKLSPLQAFSLGYYMAEGELV